MTHKSKITHLTLKPQISVMQSPHYFQVLTFCTIFLKNSSPTTDAKDAMHELSRSQQKLNQFTKSSSWRYIYKPDHLLHNPVY